MEAPTEDVLGPLDLEECPPCPTAEALLGTDLARGYYEPSFQPTFDARVGVVFCPFQWDEDAPWIWLLATVGLSAIRQQQPESPSPRAATVSPHLELCFALREPPEPEWAAFRRAWEEDALDTFPSVPGILGQLALVAQDFASWMVRDRAAFALFDHVENVPLVPGRSAVLLAPPIPELVASGVLPFDASGAPGELAVGQWTQLPALRAAGDHLFLQLVPLFPDELEAARWNGSAFFARALLPTDDELAAGADASTHITNLDRASRRAFFG